MFSKGLNKTIFLEIFAVKQEAAFYQNNFYLSQLN
jgi:hypothetical protein